MPSSRYVQLDVKNKQAMAGELNCSRRSQRIRSNSRTRARSIDLDETVLNDRTTVDESGDLLADESPPMKKKPDIDAMDVNENDLKIRSHSSPPLRRKVAGPVSMRGGAKGYLTNDPLTSSTMKSTPFSVVRRRNAKKNAERDKKDMVKEKSRSKIRERFDSSDEESTQNNADDIANNIDEQEFRREVARKRAQREEALHVRDESTTTKAYASGFNPPDGEQQEKRQQTSFDESFVSRQQQSSRQNESDLVTARIVNNNSSSSNSNLSETLAATQPWEKELDGLPFFQGNTLNQNHLHQPNQSFIAPPQISVGQQLYADYDSQFDSQMNQTANHDASTKLYQSSSVSLSADQQQKSTTDSQPNIQWGRSRMQEESATTNNSQSAISSFGNSNLRKLPPQPPSFDKASAPIVPRISLGNLGNIGRKDGQGKNSARDDDNMNNIMSSKRGEGDTWREDAFRSSLLDLIGSFPTNFFDTQEENRRMIYAISNVDEESPHSTTQKAASSQLNHKRLFDAASRSLVRLAIASRRTTKIVDSNEYRDDGESPDFNPPSPRSLPAYMSVLNVHDDSNHPGRSRQHWQAGNANTTEVFAGQSVHGRNARTLRLSTTGNSIRSSNPFSSWSSNELVYGVSVLAAQVVHEASRDTTQSKQGEDVKVLSTLVESCLGFLATTFACLESDFVYSVLKSTLRSDITVFDALSHLSPVTSPDGTLDEADAVSSLALLALSRGLDAAITAARLTSLDPSSACMAYSPPHKFCGTNINIYDQGIDSNGVGWNSAIGRDLGLKLEDHLGSRPRYMHLNDIAMYAYDVILEYNPMSDDHGFPRCDVRDATKYVKSRGSHYIDTQDGRRQTMDTVECSQPSVMKDRLYAATVEYLSSMIRSGIISGWLTNSLASAHAAGDSNTSICSRTTDKLCQKLFFVIETVARRRRSTNQISGSPDSGDSEAVCAASLTLLVLALSNQVSQSETSSLSTSFRQMGTSTGSLDDLLHSTLVRNMIELALSWQNPRSSRGSNKENDSIMKNHAASNTMYILGDICIAGGSSLICQDFSQRVDNFLQAITYSICESGRTRTGEDYCLNFDSALLLVLQLHIQSPIMVRTFLRKFMESNDDSASSFVGGLLRLAADDSFAVSSCASCLLRALVEGNPADRTEDKLSDMILKSLDTDQVGSDLNGMIHLILETTHTSLKCNIPNFSMLFHLRMCSLGDLLCALIRIPSASKIFASFISDDVLNLFAQISEDGENHNCNSDTLNGSAKMSIVSLFASFATATGSRTDMIAQQRQVREKFISSPGYLTLLEAAMSQGISVDSTRRAIKLQSSLLSLTDERFLAHTLTNSRNSATRRENSLKEKLVTYQSEIRQMDEKFRQIVLNCNVLTDSLRDQRLAYDRQLEWTRAEHHMASKNVSEIFAYERRQAEEQYSEERKARLKIERENEQLTHDCSSYKFRIDKLDELLQLERKARQIIESEFGTCKNELSRTSNVCNDLQAKLSASEVKVSNLTAINEESKSTIEEICSKLIKLSTIYQVKEQEMDKYKAELRSAVNTANRHADTAIEKYESANRENKLLSDRLKEVSAELSEVKTRKADVQRMRKNAPVAYLNQLHRDPTIPQRITLQDAGQRRSPRRQGNSKTQN